jgi:cytoskeletal protein CcmA (bactofilin family)
VGRVNADVHADAVIVSGHVTGSLLATSRIAVRSTAIIDGDLSAPVMRVEEGAEIRGKMDIEGTKVAAGLRLAS